MDFGLLEIGFYPSRAILEFKMYQENKDWAAKLKSEGYTVIDLGNPYPKINGFSPFYATEKNTIFSEGR